MKKVKKLYFLCLIALTFIVCAIIFGTFINKNTVTASADNTDRTNYMALLHIKIQSMRTQLIPTRQTILRATTLFLIFGQTVR